MFLYKLLFVTFIAAAQGRYLTELNSYPVFFVDHGFDEFNHQTDDFDAGYSRMKRQAGQLHGQMNTNPDGSANLMGKLPLAGGENNMLSAIESVSGLKTDASKFTPGFNQGPGYGAAGGGLLLENRNGHALSVTGQHIPTFGDQLTAAGKVNLLHTDNHNLDANAFITRNMPKSEFIPNFNKYGGSVDYMYKDKIGGSLGMAHTDLFQKTDYSAMGKFNAFKTPTSSFDLNAGFSKSVSPYIPHSSWQPSAGFTFTKYF